jgi:hypothetical protein
MSQPPKVLFVSYGGGHIGMVLPVMRELETLLPGVQCKLLALTTAHKKAKAARPEALGYRDFLHLVDAGAARAWGERLSEGNTSPDVSRDETIAYLGINYLDLIAQHGKTGAADLYREQGRYGFRPLHFMRKVMDALQPDAVVATNSPRSERTALNVAGERGLPSIGMVDLFGLDSDTYVLHEPKPAWTCVISEGVRQRLIARGFSADGVVVTGNPAFDGLFSADNRARAQAFLTERGWQDLKPVLFAGHWEPQAHPATPVPVGQALPREIEAVLRETVRARDDLALVVRYHPSDWTQYPRLPDEPRVHFSEPPNEPIHPLILASHVVVVQTSTVGLESTVGGKPVISVENSPAAHVWFSLAQQGVSTPAATPSDLPQVLNAVLAGHAQPSDPSYSSDGLASRRVAAVVTKALTGRSAEA